MTTTKDKFNGATFTVHTGSADELAVVRAELVSKRFYTTTDENSYASNAFGRSTHVRLVLA